MHSCKFVDYTPAAVTCIAVCPLAPPNPRSRKSDSKTSSSSPGPLAIGKGNGTISICEWAPSANNSEISRNWMARRILRGLATMKVGSVAFAIRDPYSHTPGVTPSLQDLRLFSTTQGKDLLEWDISTGLVKKLVDSDAGAIWSMAVNPDSTTIALGCVGGIRLLSLSDDAITPFKSLDYARIEPLSLAWGPMVYFDDKASNSAGTSSELDDDSKRWTNSILVAGCSDASICKWDTNTGRVIEAMRLPKTGEQLLVWAVGVTPDGTVVSGDSDGYITFWDPVTNTQLHRFPAHDADLLCLAIGPDGKTVYTSGIDQRITEFCIVTYSGPDDSSKENNVWTKTFAKRVHSHDVCALATWPPLQLYRTKLAYLQQQGSKVAEAPVILSGGVDASIYMIRCSPPVTSQTTFVDPRTQNEAFSFQKALPCKMNDEHIVSPGGRVVQIARQARYIVCRSDTRVTVWGFNKLNTFFTLGDSVDVGDEDSVKLLEMDLKISSTLASCAVSDDGTWLGAADSFETKLFKLKGLTGVRLKAVRVKRLSETLLPHIFPSSSPSSPMSASSICFSPDSRRLVLAIASLIIVLDLTNIEASDSPHILCSFPHHRYKSGAGFSIDQGRVIKSLPGDASSDGDDGEDTEDAETSKDHGIEGKMLPASHWPPISRLVVSPDGQWLASADLGGRIHVFHLTSRKYHCSLPTSLTIPSDLAFDPSSPHTLYLAFPDNSLQIFDVKAREYPGWALPLCRSILPQRIVPILDSTQGILFIPKATSIDAPREDGAEPDIRKVLLWGKSWMCSIDIDMHIQRSHQRGNAASGESKKQKRKSQKANPNSETFNSHRGVSLLTSYRDVLCIDVLNGDEIVVIQRPWEDILQTLPPAYFRIEYGRG
ncbi:quinon protein alcohol dehydrogenase-like superfamily [Cantharellus anzutake]|uniref:quinon protein alcohol dehydrogenase-like superfamily n=1 Tax=Cantharellus anzutake TaxID=1750568 RepID=UPI001907E75D|nr:quinon protein alcohol dehydrogenase-like superfamily [Cantharellus anzutake]KAF8343078.1 quinon protein alcohol dehydrogenase-like superfamily [Cantharellus anzutake]